MAKLGNVVPLPLKSIQKYDSFKRELNRYLFTVTSKYCSLEGCIAMSYSNKEMRAWISWAVA